MPVVVMHGGGATGALSSKTNEPNSHLCISILTIFINPPLGLFALIFSCWSRRKAEMDWDGAENKGRIALWLAIAGVAISVASGLVFVLVVFTKDAT